MSRMSDLHLTIQEELMNGDLTNVEIAERYNIPLSWVEAMVVELSYYTINCHYLKKKMIL